MIEFGNPIDIPADLVEKFKKGGEEKREACSTLLDTIFYGLKSVTVNASNEQTLMVTCSFVVLSSALTIVNRAR